MRLPGGPEDSSLGIRLSGVDALSAAVEVDIRNLPALLMRYKEQSELSEYRNGGFAFVDFMQAVAATGLRNELNTLLLTMLQNNGAAEAQCERPFGFSMVIPTIIDFSTTDGFRYSTNIKRHPLRHDINVNSFLTHKLDGRDAKSRELGTRRAVYGFSGTQQITQTWSALECLTGELEHLGKRYVLNSRNWYRVDSDYVKDLDNYIATIPKYGLKLPQYSGGTEKDYNIGVARNFADIYNFDRRLIHPVSKQSIEYCDLYTESQGYRDLIHIKHGTSSAVLSHLFPQGTTSSEVSADYDVCRDQAAKMVDDSLRNF